jgi:hypothetical protein
MEVVVVVVAIDDGRQCRPVSDATAFRGNMKNTQTLCKYILELDQIQARYQMTNSNKSDCQSVCVCEGCV